MKTGLTYSDVLLVPKRTTLKSRSQADVRTYFTRNISLNIPLVSANMMDVTEYKMAAAMAREGGIGILHQFNTIEEQAAEIKKVKKSTCYIIEEPISALPSLTLQQAVDKMKLENVTSLLVKEGDELQGILTARDYSFEDDLERRISEIMTPREKLVTADYGINLHEAKKILHEHRIEKLPLLKDGKVYGLITTQDIKKQEYWFDAVRDAKGRLRVGAAVGVKDTMERAEALINAGVDVLVLDVAHAHSDFVIKRLKELKNAFPSIDVMVGNIATVEAAKELINAGADGLKVGIGPSPVCTTRIMSGAGIPQLTAVMNVYEIAKEYSIPISADGGMSEPGDVVKALAAGASTAYSGSFFAGTDEAPGKTIKKDGRRYKQYRGSASYESNEERKERLEKKKIREELDVYVEGISALVDYKGSVSAVIRDLIKGIQSGISYGGGRNIKELQEKAEFISVTGSGRIESLSRGIKTRE